MSQAIISEPYRNANGVTVGRLAGDGYLEKTGLDYRMHHLFSYGGWATESSHLDQLRADGGRGIRLILRDGRVFESTLAQWELHSYKPKGLESDQAVLPDRYWRVNAPGARQLVMAL